MSKIIACMPALNEEKYIGSLVLKTRQYVDQVIVVDDGSTDDTLEIAKLAGAKVIQHKANKGYGAAIQTIFAAAKKINPEVLVILDADAQHNPREIPRLIKPILDGNYDCVIGTRRGQSPKIPFYRRIGQSIILRSVKTISNDELTDSECGFRAFSRKAIKAINLKETGMAASAETVAEVKRKNLKMTQIPVNVTYNKDSSSIHPVRHGLSVFTRIVGMISDQRPIFFFGLSGLIILIAGLAFGIRVLNLYSQNQILPTGNALISLVLVVIGMFSIFTGFILSSLQKKQKGRSTFNRILMRVADQNPLIFFGIGGLILVLIGLGFGIRVLNLFAENQVLPTGNTLVSVIFLIVGTFSIFTGLILRALSHQKK